MTTKASEHVKHAALARPPYGDFGRNEFGILGAPCAIIRHYARQWTECLKDYQIAYVDADHKAETPDNDALPDAALQYADKIGYKRIDFKQEFNPFHNRQLFNGQDLVLINGNHFNAKKQIVIIHPDKTLEHKLDKLTNVALILLSEGQSVPQYLADHLTNDVATLPLNDTASIVAFIRQFLHEAVPPLNGLVLTGGKSTRMGSDKAQISYHGKTQQEHMRQLLLPLCKEVFISAASGQGDVIADTFIGLGPFGGILSAMQFDPNKAWLTVACDLPYLSAATLQYLVEHRNPSKLATAFSDSDSKFPEPLITIWEPRAYPVMLQFLSQGYSCPRKVLINSNIELLQAPDVSEFRNVNHPEERDEAMRYFNLPAL